MQNSASDFGREGLEFIESTAGGDPGRFEERRIQHKSAAIDKGVIGRFEWFAIAAGSGVACKQVFVELEIRLKIHGFAGAPFLLASEGSDEFAAKSGGVFAQHRARLAAAGGKRFFVGNFQRASGEGEQGLALKKSEQIAVHGGVGLQRVASVLDDVGVHETRNDPLALQAVSEAQRQFGGSVEFFGDFHGHLGSYGSSTSTLARTSLLNRQRLPRAARKEKAQRFCAGLFLFSWILAGVLATWAPSRVQKHAPAVPRYC